MNTIDLQLIGHFHNILVAHIGFRNYFGNCFQVEMAE